MSVCQHADRAVSTVLIHAVAMPVLEQLIQHATADKPRDESEILIVIEGMRLAEVLVSLAEEHTSKTPVFCNVICTQSFKSQFFQLTQVSLWTSAEGSFLELVEKENQGGTD